VSPVAQSGVSATRLMPCGAGRWCLTGAMDFSTVTRLAGEGDALFGSLAGADSRGVRFWRRWSRSTSNAHRQVADAERPRVEIDLSGVEAANSAGLALLLEWLDMAHARGVCLTYRGIPDSLERIADFSNIRSLLPLAAASH
jgi:phospholipid transport system transporter-binding protein